MMAAYPLPFAERYAGNNPKMHRICCALSLDPASVNPTGRHDIFKDKYRGLLLNGVGFKYRFPTSIDPYCLMWDEINIKWTIRCGELLVKIGNISKIFICSLTVEFSNMTGL